jgi:hypothetical protein
MYLPIVEEKSVTIPALPPPPGPKILIVVENRGVKKENHKEGFQFYVLNNRNTKII